MRRKRTEVKKEDRERLRGREQGYMERREEL